MSSEKTSLPTHHRALVIESVDRPPTVQERPLPEVLPGTAVFRVLSTSSPSYSREIFQSSSPGYRAYPFPKPIVPGFAAIGRIVAVGQDATTLKPGQLIFYDPFVRARDLDGTSSTSPALFLSAVHEGGTDASRKLMAQGGVRDGSYAEYMRAMLENCYILDEARLTGPKPQGLGYSTSDLTAIVTLLVAYGGLRDVNVRAGEMVLVSPATGPFSSGGCIVALAMGAKVIAWARSAEKLQSLKTKLSTVHGGRYAGLVETVQLTGDAEQDLAEIRQVSPDGVDVFFDIAPPAASTSHHLKTGMLALRHSGRASLMGGILTDVAIPFRHVMRNDITIKGKWMYERRDVVELIKMIERGVLAIGEAGGWESVGRFGLEQWKEAWDLAYERSSFGEMVTVEP